MTEEATELSSDDESVRVLKKRAQKEIEAEANDSESSTSSVEQLKKKGMTV